MGKDSEDEFDIDEVFSLDMDPEAAIKAVLDGAGVQGDQIHMDVSEPDD